MRNITKLLISAIMVISASVTANAALDLGDVSGESFTLSSNVVAPGSFDLTGSFQLGAGSGSAFGTKTFNIDYSDFTNITDFQFIVKDFFTGTTSFDSGVLNTQVSTQSFTIGSGSYEVDFSGTTTGGGFFAVNVAPVPEASVVAMMLGGLGVVGFMSKRRRK